jgi:hypothetical protein
VAVWGRLRCGIAIFLASWSSWQALDAVVVVLARGWVGGVVCDRTEPQGRAGTNHRGLGLELLGSDEAEIVCAG